jgi:hypothetical protein
MKMTRSNQPGTESVRPFPDIVGQRFSFLSDFGFAEVESLPTVVRYRKGSLDLNVYYGRQSLEVGFQVARGDEQYSISEIIRTNDAAAAGQYRNSTATTQPELVSAIERLAALVRRYGEPVLRDDPKFFADLRRRKQSWSETYAIDVLEEQLRPKAEAAFREGRYREAADLYDRIRARLTPSELKKLDMARRRS